MAGSVLIGARRRRGVLEAVGYGHEPVRAPQRRSAGQRTRPRSPRGSSGKSARPAAPTSVCCEGPLEKAENGFRREGGRVDRAPEPEGRPAQAWATRTAPRKRVKTCAGRSALVAASQICARLVVETIPAADTSTSAVTSCGRATARRRAMTPPME